MQLLLLLLGLRWLLLLLLLLRLLWLLLLLLLWLLLLWRLHRWLDPLGKVTIFRGWYFILFLGLFIFWEQIFYGHTLLILDQVFILKVVFFFKNTVLIIGKIVAGMSHLSGCVFHTLSWIITDEMTIELLNI